MHRLEMTADTIPLQETKINWKIRFGYSSKRRLAQIFWWEKPNGTKNQQIVITDTSFHSLTLTSVVESRWGHHIQHFITVLSICNGYFYFYQHQPSSFWPQIVRFGFRLPLCSSPNLIGWHHRFAININIATWEQIFVFIMMQSTSSTLLVWHSYRMHLYTFIP